MISYLFWNWFAFCPDKKNQTIKTHILAHSACRLAPPPPLKFVCYICSKAVVVVLLRVKAMVTASEVADARLFGCSCYFQWSQLGNNLQSLKTQLCYIIYYKILLALEQNTFSAGCCCPLLVKIMAVSTTRIPFDTVATYNDKRNNNTVNIALHRISPPKQTQTPSAAAVMASNLRPMSSSISMASSFSSSSTVSSVNMHLHINE